MASSKEEVKLLFFDTFIHDQNKEELNLDLIQFQRPVVVYEVRVIPLKTQVEANLAKGSRLGYVFLKGSRLGGTIPSEFKLDVFVNNLEEPNASTFEKLGVLDYKENTNIQLKPDREIPTDGLILKGWYKTVTFAVYGWVTAVKPPHESPPPPPPPLPSHQVALIKSKSSEAQEVDVLKPPPTQQQHPLDFINEQLQQRQQQQLYTTPSQSTPAPQSSRDPHRPPPLEEAFVEVLRKPSPRRDRDRGTSRERASSRDRGSSRDRASSRDRGSSRDRASSHDSYDAGRELQDHRRDYSFPPEPKEPYDIREKDVWEEERPRSREVLDRDIGRHSRHESRESEGKEGRGLSPSREGSREPRDYKERERDKAEIDRLREENIRVKEKEKELERERERREREEREKEREQEAKEREKREQEQREREKESQRESERERELQRERELREKEREREEREREKEKERDRERERDKERELERERERDKERELEREKELRSKERSEHERKRRSRNRSPKHGSPDSSGSRSKSRQRSRSRSRQRSHSKQKSRSPEVKRPPEPPLNGEETGGEEDEFEEDAEIEDQEIFETLSDRSSSRRRQRIGYDGDAQETEGYEDISSDEEMGGIEDPSMMQVLYEMEDDTWGPGTLNATDFYLSPLVAFPNPALTLYELEVAKLEGVTEADAEICREANSLMDVIYKYREDEHGERWVVALEDMPAELNKGLSYLLTVEKKQWVVDTLISWVMEGCDLEGMLENSKSDAAYMVRQLKIGIKLAGCLASSDEQICHSLLKRGIQSRLLSLFESTNLVFSLKHLVLRTLSKTTHFPVGIQWFLGTHPDMNPEEKQNTAYQRLVKSVLIKKNVKLTMSVTAILRKVHLYETLNILYECAAKVVATASAIEDEASNKEGDESEEPPSLSEEEENKILGTLSEVTEILRDPHKRIGQQANAVPYSLLVETCGKFPDTYPAIFKSADACGVLESVFVLLSCPSTVSVPSIYLAVHSLLKEFMDNQEGLLYLASHPDVTNGILRALLQMVEEQEDAVEEIPSRQLGLELFFHLQTIQFIDQLVDFHKRGMKVIDDPEPISILHSLYTMTFSCTGRDPLLGRNIVVKVLGYDRNLDVLLPFLEKTGDEDHDAELRKSVCANYAIQLLLGVIKTSTDMEMLEHYAHKLMALCEDNTSAKLKQLQEWLTPATKVTSYDLDGLPSMIVQLKAYADDVKKVPPGLIMIMRIIYSLIEPSRTNGDESENLNEAKYRYALLELYSAECFTIFINIIQKLSESQLKVWQQGIPYTVDQWLTYFSLIKPTLALVHATLCQLIQAFGTENSGASTQEQVETKKAAGEETASDKEPLIMNPFKDLTPIPVLLELHTVMCSVPTSSLYNSDLAKIQKDIVDTLLAFTQEELQQTQTDDALGKSLWTLMLKDLLKYTIKSPYTYMSGLLILSELLPLPFPLHTKTPLSEEEMDSAIVARKLWSVHLQAATPELFSALDTLSGTGCQPLQHLMRRVCWQIADLAAPSSLRITKILFDILMVNLKPKKPTQSAEGEKKEGEEEATAVRTVSIHTAKTLNLLAYLLSHPGIKAALLQLIGSSIISEVKYKDFLPIMLQLLNQTAETPAEIQAQEGIVSMVQNLCDLEVSMVNTDLPVTLAEHLANSLPESCLMGEIMAALLEHIGNPSQTYASILPCLRTLIMLTDHDYGFYHLTVNLKKNITTIHSLLNRINNTFSKDSSDCLSTLSAVLELLRLMITIDLAEEMAVTRTRIISREELRQFLLWNADVRHPLEELEELSKEEETLETLLESITALTTILRDTSSVSQVETKQDEIFLPVPATLNDLFSQRAVFTLLDSEDERLNPSYWLANPAADEPDAEPEVLRCDLQAICEHHLPDFNLEEELKKETTPVEEDIVRPRKLKDRRKSQEVIDIYRGKPGRKPFVAPMRGRGIMTHGMMSGRSNDLFRSRAPNTSRPPSMHVDDFVKMENSQQQHEQQQQQQPPRPPATPPLVPGVRDSREKEPPRGRGRGGFDRGRGFPMLSQGRFFSPGAYRREPIIHDPHPPPPPVPHPPHRGGSRLGIGLIALERSRPNFMAPRPFSRGPENRPGHPPLERRGGRNGRFSPSNRGGRGQWGRGRDLESSRFGFRGRRDLGRHARTFTQ